MRSLFFKIFFSFWLSIILATFIVSLIVEARRSEDMRESFRSMIIGVLSVNAYTFAQAYENQGCAGLRAQELSLQQAPPHLRSFFLDDNGNPVCTQFPAPSAAAKAAAVRASEDGTIESTIDDRQRVLAKRFITASGHPYRMVVVVPRPQFPFFGWAPFRRLALFTVVISGLVCFLLARYLTAPITRLRAAAQQIAQGDLTARVPAKSGRPGDEVGQLVVDFNHMAERLEILIGAQQRLIRDMSHELRSPLTRLVLALGLARQKNGANQEALDRMEKEAERLNELIGRVLGLSRLESATELPAKSPTSLAQLVQTILADVEIEARMRNCSSQYTAPRDYTLAANFELLRSALENVVRNAIRYTTEGTAVEITAERTHASSPMEIVIRVRDHGPGVPESELQNLFRPFYRLDASRERQTGGVGLGLTIAERAVKLHGGSISAHNAEGGGLLVEISLPLSPA